MDYNTVSERCATLTYHSILLTSSTDGTKVGTVDSDAIKVQHTSLMYSSQRVAIQLRHGCKNGSKSAANNASQFYSPNCDYELNHSWSAVDDYTRANTVYDSGILSTVVLQRSERDCECCDLE